MKGSRDEAIRQFYKNDDMIKAADGSVGSFHDLFVVAVSAIAMGQAR